MVTDSSAYLSLDLSEYISVERYTGLTVTVKEGEDKASLILKAIWEKSNVIKYPGEQVNYYYNQTRQMYLDLASGDEDRYEEILAQQNVTEDTILKDARDMVKNDLIFYYIVKDADITLTEEEKNSLYEQYVDYYVKTYKYSEDYVKENMSSLIYDSMLYDKTMEYLILNNNFTTEDK
jgi:FKBP-type peptidyl-prolyl cis-trans isomerase (trigger factor)